MKTKLFITSLLLTTSLFLSAKTVVLKGTVSVKYIERCKNGLDTLDANDALVLITAINATTKVSESFGSATKNGNFNFTIDDRKFEYIIFSIFDSETKQTFTVKNLIKQKNINITLYQKKYSTSADFENGGTPNFNTQGGGGMMVKKPAIYLYPTKTDTITVKLDFKGQLGTTFPKYNNGWKVIAQPNGEIINLADTRTYNYLFWEGSYNFTPAHYDYPYGTVVSKPNLTGFLQERLSYIGLNNTEINDFMVYWLPELEKNYYNLIFFFINDDIDGSAFLDVNPKPDTEIRIYMEFKKVDADFKITPQTFPRIERKGFTLVEWGGGVNNKIE